LINQLKNQQGDTHNIVMLDCCRYDMDFPVFREGQTQASSQREVETQAAHASAAPLQQARQLIVAHASAADTKAGIKSGEDHSLLIEEFVKVLESAQGAKVPFHHLFREVTSAVSKKSKGLQEPWYTAAGLRRYFYFSGEDKAGEMLYKVSQPNAVAPNHRRKRFALLITNIANSEAKGELKEGGNMQEVMVAAIGTFVGLVQENKPCDSVCFLSRHWKGERQQQIPVSAWLLSPKV
jgi:hypothetical protein